VGFEPLMGPFLVVTHQTRIPATSAARIAVRRRTEDMSCPAVD